MNSTTIHPADRALFWHALEVMHANTAEMPVYWETVEPEEGAFDFTIVDTLLSEAHEHNMRLIVLWFATWKNGMMKYCPAWVKNQPERFRRFMAHDGALLTNLSTSCGANLAADRNAYCRLMEHIREHDKEGTVLAVQIQNEPGAMGRALRDYQPSSIAQYQDKVPDAVLRNLLRGDCDISRAWLERGGTVGSWPETFGKFAPELFSAWQVADYINEIARAGKAIHPIPCFVNVWMDNVGYDMPGLDYPLGGPVTKVLDLWKWCTPDIDMLCPDIYPRNKGLYDAICAAYARADNPLFVPESDCRRGQDNECNMFSAIGNYGAIGFFAFGVEHVLHPDGTPNEAFKNYVASFHSLSAIAPLLARSLGSGRVRAVRQEDYTSECVMHIGDYIMRIVYGYERTDFRHNLLPSEGAARGLIIQIAEDEFCFAGIGYTAVLIPRYTAIPYENRVLERCINYESVEEGYYSADGQWVRTKIRTGDESDAGIWVHSTIGCVRVKLCK